MSTPSLAPPDAGATPGPAVAAPQAATSWGILLEPLPADTRGQIALGQSLASAVDALRANKMRSPSCLTGECHREGGHCLSGIVTHAGIAVHEAAGCDRPASRGWNDTVWQRSWRMIFGSLGKGWLLANHPHVPPGHAG